LNPGRPPIGASDRPGAVARVAPGSFLFRSTSTDFIQRQAYPMRQLRLIAVLALAGLAGFGCSAESRVKLVPVVGTVTQGGKPLANAALSFVPDPGNKDSTPGTASSDATGYYSASWLTRTGLAPGTYKVLITADPSSGGGEIPPEFQADPLMAQLRNAAANPTPKAAVSVKSEFKADVTDGKEPIDFDVGRAPSDASKK